MSTIRRIMAHFTAPRCVVCGTRKDRPEGVCTGKGSIAFHHVWEES